MPMWSSTGIWISQVWSHNSDVLRPLSVINYGFWFAHYSTTGKLHLITSQTAGHLRHGWVEVCIKCRAYAYLDFNGQPSAGQFRVRRKRVLPICHCIYYHMSNIHWPSEQMYLLEREPHLWTSVNWLKGKIGCEFQCFSVEYYVRNIVHVWLP